MGAGGALPGPVFPKRVGALRSSCSRREAMSQGETRIIGDKGSEHTPKPNSAWAGDDVVVRKSTTA